MGTSRKQKVALINVVMEGDYQYPQEIPLGLAYIGSFLREQAYTVSFKQCLAQKCEKEIESAAEVEADVYGFQLDVDNYLSVRSVIEKLKARNPQAITVLGGPYISASYEGIFRNEPLFDFMIIGEGEETMLALLQALENKERDLSQINGLLWRDASSKIVANAHRKPMEDLDRLPFPSRDFLENAKHDPVDGGLVESLRMVTSRGCVGNCSFCCVNLFQRLHKGKIWRGRSPENVVDELEYLNKNYNARLFNFADSSFEDPGEIGKMRSGRICQEIIRRKLPVSIKIYLRCETMKSDRDVELLRLYKQAGIDIVIIGGEAGSEYELRLYEKRATLEDNYRIVKILRELDLFYVLMGFIMFGPNSTLNTLRQNIEFLYQTGFAENALMASNSLILIRGSKLYEMMKKEDRLIDTGRYWESPQYRMRDPAAERMMRHWSNPFRRFPLVFELNKLQVNSGNLIARMNNPMNKRVLEAMGQGYLDFKKAYTLLSAEFNKLQYEQFKHDLELIEQDCADDKVAVSVKKFFTDTYQQYVDKYALIYNGFLSRINNAGFSLSGLVFKHFLAAMNEARNSDKEFICKG